MVATRSHLYGLMLATVLAGVGCKGEGNGERVPATVPVRASANLESVAAKPETSSCRMLVSMLCSQFGQESGVCRRIGVRSQRFSNERCTAMLTHYAKVADEAQRVEDGNLALLAAHGSEPLGHPPFFGPADAKLTLVVFSDFTCDDCARGSPVATQIRNRYPEVRFVFRQFPLATRPESHLLAEASLAANSQGKFWEFHDILFSNQHDLSRGALERYAKEVGIQLGKFRKALDTNEYAAQVDADMELGKRAVIHNPPALFANGEWVDFPYDVGALDEVIEGAKAAL